MLAAAVIRAWARAGLTMELGCHSCRNVAGTASKRALERDGWTVDLHFSPHALSLFEGLPCIHTWHPGEVYNLFEQLSDARCDAGFVTTAPVSHYIDGPLGTRWHPHSWQLLGLLDW